MGHKKRLLIGGLAAVVLCAALFSVMGAADPSRGVEPDASIIPTQTVALAFSDVPADAQYAEAVNWCRENGLMSGTSDTIFSPDATLTRAMVATVLYRAAGEPAVSGVPAFDDTEANTWYSNAVVWANQNAIVQGYGDGRFGTEDPITQEQLDLLVRRYKGETAVWTGDPALAVPVTRAQAAAAFYENLRDNTPDTNTPSKGTPVVYMTTDISPEGLMAVYEALGWEPTGKVAVKLSTGEPPASNYLRPELIKDLVQAVDGTIVECNTAYGGSRAETAMHYQVAEDHGFTAIADFQILDENGSMTLPVSGGSVLTENYVGAAFADYDSYLILSHFKGHAMAGYGGAIKNISIGLGSSEGKNWIHTGGKSRTSWMGGDQNAFLESMAEAGKSVSDYLGGGERIVYVNVMNRLSVDCDCSGRPAEPDIHDIGILASTDPVALDQACIDLVYKAEGNTSLVNRIESRNGLHTLEHAQEIGLGSRAYELVSLDQTATPASGGDETTDQSRVLVAYFSRTGENYSVGVIDKGNTAIVAELIAEQTGGDLFEIVPVNPYPSDYEEVKTVAMEEKNSKARPAIADTVESWDEYDVVFLGYPIWHADMPMIVYNFLESYDFSDKTVIPFNTHEGSGQSGTQSRIASTIPNATVAGGLAIRGDTAQNNTASAKSSVEKWIAEDLKDILP